LLLPLIPIDSLMGVFYTPCLLLMTENKPCVLHIIVPRIIIHIMQHHSLLLTAAGVWCCGVAGSGNKTAGGDGGSGARRQCYNDDGNKR
jgi:hypothetical protein